MRLVRDNQNAERTYGQLVADDGAVLCQTLELPWRDNQHGISCIPAGTYTAFRFQSPTIGYELFQVRAVPHRSGIDIHIGNTAHDTQGCILVGSSRGQLEVTPGLTLDAVLGSRDAFGAFMAALAGLDTVTLEVVDPPAGALA